MKPEFTLRRLKEGERIAAFDCGDEDLNDFILNESHLYRGELLAVSYVAEDPQGRALAYFSLANDKVSQSEFESRTEFNRFRRSHFVNEKRLRSYPAVKLCRFAVDRSAREMHLGTMLLNFMKGYFVEDNKTGCRFLTVDAYLSAIPFYKKNNFRELTESDRDSAHTRLLYYDLKMMED